MQNYVAGQINAKIDINNHLIKFYAVAKRIKMRKNKMASNNCKCNVGKVATKGIDWS